jgi:hypothetical protein
LTSGDDFLFRVPLTQPAPPNQGALIDRILIWINQNLLVVSARAPTLDLRLGTFRNEENRESRE